MICSKNNGYISPLTDLNILNLTNSSDIIYQYSLNGGEMDIPVSKIENFISDGIVYQINLISKDGIRKTNFNNPESVDNILNERYGIEAVQHHDFVRIKNILLDL